MCGIGNWTSRFFIYVCGNNRQKFKNDKKLKWRLETKCFTNAGNSRSEKKNTGGSSVGGGKVKGASKVKIKAELWNGGQGLAGWGGGD